MVFRYFLHFYKAEFYQETKFKATSIAKIAVFMSLNFCQYWFHVKSDWQKKLKFPHYDLCADLQSFVGISRIKVSPIYIPNVQSTCMIAPIFVVFCFKGHCNNWSGGTPSNSRNFLAFIHSSSGWGIQSV